MFSNLNHMLLVVLGTFFFILKQNEEFATEKLGWLPLVALVVFISAFAIGYGPIPFVLLGKSNESQYWYPSP